MNIMKKIPIFIVVFCIIFVPCSFFVSADNYDYVLEFPFEEPVIDEWTGYLLQPRYQYNFATGGNITFDLVFWKITPINTSSNTSVPAVVYDYYSGSKIQLVFGTGVQNTIYTVSVFRSASNGDTSLGSIIPVYTGLISYDNSYTFTLDLTSRYDQLGRPLFKNLEIMDTTWPSGGPRFTSLWASQSIEYRELISANDKLTSLINGLDLTNEQLEQTYSLLSDYLNKMYTSLGDIDWILGELYWSLLDFTYIVDENQSRIIELLEQLIDGTEDFTESSTLSDEQNELNRVEDELLNNEDASNAQNDIKVEINESAMSYIWDVITSFVNSNPKVFGLFISILSLGIIALILNR